MIYFDEGNTTEREYAILTECLRWVKEYDDSNPDVGMGPTLQTLLGRLPFALSKGVSVEVVKRYSAVKGRTRGS